MGVDLGVKGIRDLDGKFAEMMKIKKLCEKSKISYPIEVQQYFGPSIGEDEELITEEMSDIDINGCMKEWGNEYAQGYEIDVKKIPKDVKKIRVYLG